MSTGKYLIWPRKFALNDAQSHSESGKKKLCPIKRSANLYFKRDVYIGHTQRIEKIFAPVDIARRADAEAVGGDAESGHTARLSRGGNIASLLMSPKNQL